jgi:hypothetical protein
MKFGIVLVSLCAVLLCGCQRSFNVKINGFSHPLAVTDKTCVILSGFDSIPASDLQFQEFKPCVRRALECQGYQVTDDPQKAKVEILLSYTIVGPILEGYSANPNRGSQAVARYAFSMDDVPRCEKTVYPMSSEVVYTLPVYPTYVYVKTVVLEAWDAARGAKNPQGLQFWKMMMTCTGSGSDLREEFPYMMAAAINYLGRDTRKVVSVTIKENDPQLLYIKGIDK